MIKRIKDRVYNEITIDDSVILQFIETSPFQRLKRINQYGGVNFVYPMYQVSRYEHSLGVWNILKTLGVSLEIQIAGLLHDVGHTAFSHMVDHALGNKDENFHENNLHLIKGWGEIEKLLNIHKINLKNVDQYHEIKKKMPYIGADRLDYAIRDYIGATGNKIGYGVKILEHITHRNHSIVFTDKKIAKEYALTGLEGMWLGIYDPKLAVVYQALTEMLRKGIQEQWITNEDLYTDDKTVMELFFKNKHKLDKKYLDIFTRPFNVVEGNKNDYDFKHVKHKIRYFDPPLIINSKKIGLSSIDKDFSDKLSAMVAKFEKAKKGNYLKVIFK